MLLLPSCCSSQVCMKRSSSHGLIILEKKYVARERQSANGFAMSSVQPISPVFSAASKERTGPEKDALHCS